MKMSLCDYVSLLSFLHIFKCSDIILRFTPPVIILCVCVLLVELMVIFGLKVFSPFDERTVGRQIYRKKY